MRTRQVQVYFPSIIVKALVGAFIKGSEISPCPLDTSTIDCMYPPEPHDLVQQGPEPQQRGQGVRQPEQEAEHAAAALPVFILCCWSLSNVSARDNEELNSQHIDMMDVYF